MNMESDFTLFFGGFTKFDFVLFGNACVQLSQRRGIPHRSIINPQSH